MSKTFYIIAGANGSGKTTFAMTYAEDEDLYGLFVKGVKS